MPKTRKPSASSMLITPEFDKFLTLVEEASRSTEESVKHFVEPAPGTLRRATSKRHHIVLGRRGSGKSSLLRKAAANLTTDRRPIAYVDLEQFKGHSYPDVLLSILISTFREFKHWMDTAAIHPATKKSFWNKFFGTTPKRGSFNRKQTSELSKKLDQEMSELLTELHRTDYAELIVKSGAEAVEKNAINAKLNAGASGISAESGATKEMSQKATNEVEEKYIRSKTDFLHRNILKYKGLFRELSQISGGDSYLFLDDLYHIRRTDQARVIDYFHRLAKDDHLWLKVGTIRHRTRWYIHGDPPIGMKSDDDADEINLDLTLEKYSVAKEFLVKILNTFASEINSRHTSFLTDGALDRLVLASGGVARDFLSIFRRSVDEARSRSDNHLGIKVSAEDVNVAAGEYDSSKREEFARDTLDDDVTLENEFQKIRTFCLDDNNTNCFLLDKEHQGREVNLIHELVDLKLIHLVKSRETVSGRPGRIYEAYMLDLSQYTGSRKKRKLQLVEFWKLSSKENLRKASLIYTPKDDSALTQI